MTTPWTVDDVTPAPQGAVPWKVDDVQGGGVPWQVDDMAPTYTGAAVAHTQQGFRESVGGMMQAAGELLSPEEQSWENVVQRAQLRISDPLANPLLRISGAIDELAAGVRKKAIRAAVSPEGEVAQFGRDLAGAGKELGAEARQIMKENTPNDMNILQEAGLSAISSTAQMVPWLVAARGVPGLGVARAGMVEAGALGQFGAQSFGQTYSEARAKGAEPEVAFKAALASGGAEVLGEKLALNTLLKRGPGWFKKFVLQEIGGEEFTTVAQSLTEKGYYDPNKWSSAGEILHDLAVTGLAAAGGASAVKVADSGLAYFEAKREERRQEAAANELQDILVREQRAAIAQRLPPESVEGEIPPPMVLAPMTNEEKVLATLQREQLANGLDVAATPEGVSYGESLRAALVPMGLGQGSAPQEDVSGMTEEVLARRERTATESKPIDLLPISASGRDESVLGLTLQQTGELRPGTVVAVGRNEDLFPMEVYTRLVKSLQAWVDKYMPEARIILNLEQLGRDQFGAHAATISEATGQWTHIITPRELPSFKYQTGNLKTKMEMMTAVTHEFGHALKVQNFFDGMKGLGGGNLNTLRNQIKKGKLTPKMLEAVIAASPEEGNLLAKWQELRNAILEGKMTATEFVEQWVGIRKLGDSVHPGKNARNKDLYSWAQTQLGKVGKNLTGATALELVEAAYGDPASALNFDEFMAEQFSRAAYTNGDLEGSPIGQFFAKTLQQLRDLFRGLKTWKGENGERIVAPDETFQTWLDKQTLRAQTIGVQPGKFELSKGVKKAQKKILEEAGLAPVGKPNKAKKKEAIPPPKEEIGSQVDEKVKLGDMVDTLLEYGHLSEKQAELLRERIERGNLQHVRETLQRVLGAELNFDREYSSKVLSRLPNKEKVLAETLRSTIAMQDVKTKERAAWEKFLLGHPNGFSKQEALEALQANVLPLDYELSSDFASHGAHVLDGLKDGGWIDSDNYSRIWKVDGIKVGREARKHFKVDGYLMHSRIMDLPQGRFVLELQSDFFQNKVQARGHNQELSDSLEEVRQDVMYQFDLIQTFGEIIDLGTPEELQKEWDLAGWIFGEKYRALKGISAEEIRALLPELQKVAEESEAKLELAKNLWKKFEEKSGTILDQMEDLRGNWWERLIKEEVAQAVEDGKGKMYFPTADTVAAVEGWQKMTFLPELRGVQFLKEGKPHPWTANGEVAFEGTTFGIGTTEGMAWYAQSELPAELQWVKTAIMRGKLTAHYGEQQGIYDRYKREIAKYLKSNFKAVEVDMGRYNWLEVDLKDKSNVVINWDKENPLQPQAPQWTVEAFAGMTTEQYRQPEVVAEASGMWKRLRFESPFFKRWFGASQVVGLDGTPHRVFRGSGSKTTFLDKVGRGGHTGAMRAQKAFWFSDNHANAQWDAIQASKQGDTRSAQPRVQGFYLKMENPLVVDMAGESYDDREFTKALNIAQKQGYDGVMFKNTHAPLPGTLYAIFEPEQAKVSSNVSRFDPTDELHWDAESQGQQAAKVTSKLLQKFWSKEKLTALNTYTKVVDSLVQLQQVAAEQVEDFNLQTFMKKYARANQLKNNLQQPAEKLVKSMGRLIGGSPERVKVLHKILKAEWKSGQLQTTVKGYDIEGNEVWSEELGMGLEQQAQVAVWSVQDTLQLRKFLKDNGVDVETAEGKHVLELYMRTRNLFMFQFEELGKTLRMRAGKMYANAPALQKAELIAINGLMSKLLLSPFVPQGNFGNYVLVVKEQQLVDGKNRFVTVFKKHFENKADFDLAYLEAKKKAVGNLGVQVTSQVLEEQSGIPMQLPRDLLERLEALGEFGDEQLGILADVMTTSRYSRIAEKFEGISKQVEGGNEDFARVLADYSWRTSNYIWKTHYRFELQQSIAANRYLVKRLEKDPLADIGETKARVDRLRRNTALMQSALNYVINPPNELQGMRSFITLVYLAFNVKTALLNASTVINTWAAVSSEYGELAGNKAWAQGLKDVGDLLLYKSRRAAAEKAGEELPTVDDAEFNELIGVLDQAIKDGVVDQSYAYFLAAHANSSALLAATGGRASQLGHAISEMGMLPFQTMEKVNRIHSLVVFYKLERKAGSDVRTAYEWAVAKTNSLQNSYEQANRPELFRGKKAVLTMFMSYVQFMGWIATGGYERAANAQARQLGRSTAPAWRGTTVKIWLVYLLLGGWMGVPFGRNLMDVVQWLGRKLGWGNMEAEIREFMTHLGIDANFAMHGLLHDLGGFDLSGSFGLGRILPGTDMLVKEKPMTALETIGSLVTAASGPAGNFYKSVIEAVGHLADGDIVEAGKAMPGAIGAVSKMVDAKLRQDLRPTYGVTTKKGVRMTWDKEKQEFRDITTKELAGMAMGFNPTILSENREKSFAMNSEKYYWMTRRNDIKDRYITALKTGDRDLRLEVLVAKDKFNAQVPNASLRIHGGELGEAERTWKKSVQATEKYGAQEKKYRGVVKDIKSTYEE